MPLYWSLSMMMSMMLLMMLVLMFYYKLDYFLPGKWSNFSKGVCYLW